MKRIAFPFLSMLFLIACNDAVEQSSAASTKDTVALEPPAPARLNLDGTDSIEVLFYPNPKDQRTYSRLVLADTAVINQLQANILQDTITRSECPHDVKIYLFRGGDVYKTIYAATGDTCRYFAYAINSNPYYTPMQQSSFTTIQQLRKRAK